jgi:hypothetical protein
MRKGVFAGIFPSAAEMFFGSSSVVIMIASRSSSVWPIRRLISF